MLFLIFFDGKSKKINQKNLLLQKLLGNYFAFLVVISLTNNFISILKNHIIMRLRKTSISLTIFILGFYMQSQAQLNVVSASGMTPQQLVQNILVGTGVTVSNVKFNGSTTPIAWNNIGSFTTGTTPTNLGFNNGLIMATGNATDAAGPNTGYTTSAVSPSTPNMSDPDLLAIVSSSVTSLNDAAILEFDFIPLSDTIKFRYVFASDEYPMYVPSYNDVFAFFISGMNPTGPNYVNKNIALLPGTTTPVSIYNINNGSANSGPCVNCQYYVNNTGGSSLQANGMTTVLTAWALVIPCTQYHLKLVIADANDRNLDSWVFLEANSFSSPQLAIDTNFSMPTVSTQNAIEGCNNLILTFKYPYNVTSLIQIPIISVGGTATNGVDYPLLPTTLYIPAGSDSVQLVISPIYDHISEPTETIKLIFKTKPCGNIYDTIIFNIQNYDSLTATAYGDTTLCNNHTPLSVTALNGIPPYQYSWSNGAGNTATVIPTLTTTTQYNITVTDACLKTANDSALVVIDCDFARAGPDTTICAGGTVTLHAYSVLPGNPLFLWNTGDTTATINVSPTTTTTYIVTVTDIFSDNDTVTVFVNPLPLVIATSMPSTICLGDSSILQASGAQTYLWTANITDLSLIGQQTLENPVVFPKLSTTYTVKGTDTNTCVNTASVVVNVSPQPNPQIVVYPNPVSVFEPTVRIYDATGGNNTYFWLLGDGTSSTQQSFYHTYSDLDTGRYMVNVIVTNSFGCIDSANTWVIVRPDGTFYMPNSFTPNDDGLNDVFKAYSIGVQEFEMNIYDRWGKIIFTSKNINDGWDGKINNTLATSGTYVYVIIYKDITGINHSKSGSITVVR